MYLRFVMEYMAKIICLHSLDGNIRHEPTSKKVIQFMLLEIFP